MVVIAGARSVKTRKRLSRLPDSKCDVLNSNETNCGFVLKSFWQKWQSWNQGPVRPWRRIVNSQKSVRANELPEPEIITNPISAVERIGPSSLESLKTRIRHHTFSLGTVFLFLILVLSCKCRMRATERILAVLSSFLHLALETPDWTTGRLWLLRVGLYKLQMPVERADDWVWIIDHTNQIGVEKCFVIVGARLSKLEIGPLRHEDVQTLALIPVSKSNGAVVFEQLMETAARIGAPCQIVSDQASDLKNGVAPFLEEYPETIHVPDFKHVVAAKLKRILLAQQAWAHFSSQAARCGRQLQQTELAPIRPPNQRSKARFMNLGPLITWGGDVLEILDGRTVAARIAEHDLGIEKRRLEEKLGWVREYRNDLVVWGELYDVASISEKTIAENWYSQSSQAELAKALRGIATTQTARQLRKQLLDIVKQQGEKAKPGQRILGSSESLESIFGGFKDFEGDQRRSGLTGSVLMIPAATGALDEDLILNALETVKTVDVQEWSRDNLGTTVQSKRRLIFGEIKRKKEANSIRPRGTITGSNPRAQKA